MIWLIRAQKSIPLLNQSLTSTNAKASLKRNHCRMLSKIRDWVREEQALLLRKAISILPLILVTIASYQPSQLSQMTTQNLFIVPMPKLWRIWIFLQIMAMLIEATRKEAQAPLLPKRELSAVVRVCLHLESSQGSQQEYQAARH